MNFSIKSALAAAVMALIAGCTASAPQGIIFDTDLGNDVDDVLAMDMLHKYQEDGKVQILAVMANKDTPQSPELADLLDTWYGHPDIPVGKVVDGVMGGGFKDYALRVVSMRNPDGSIMFSRSKSGDFPDAAVLYRQVLAAQPDHSVTIVSTGFSTNLAHLLSSGPDEYSKLSGKDLLARKVKLISIMGGGIEQPESHEFNIVCDIRSAQKLFDESPVPVVTSPFELGNRILYPASSISGDFNWGVEHPMVKCYVSYMDMPYDRQTWDLTALLYAVEPEYFSVSEPGTIKVTDEGSTLFTPSADGLHRYIMADDGQCSAILARFKEIITRRPARLE